MSLKRTPATWPFYVVAFAIAVVSVLASAYAVWLERTDYFAAAGRATSNTARLVADDVGKSFEQLDALLKSTGRLYVDGLESGTEEKARLVDFVRKEIADYPQIARILVIGEAGHVVAGAGENVDAAQTANFSDRKYFRSLAAGDEGPIFEGPVRSRVSNDWVILLARRLVDRQGRFLGAVTGAIPAASFTKLFSTLDYVRHEVVALWTDDGVLVARYTPEPGAEAEVGANILSETTKSLLRERPERDHDVYVSASSVDGVTRIFAYQKLPHAPFVVIVGQPKDTADQSWGALAIGLTMLCLAVTAAAALVARQRHALAVHRAEEKATLQRRVDERTAEAMAREQTFNDAMACAPNAMAIFTADGRIVEVNAALCDMLGYARDELLSAHIASLMAPEEKPLDLRNLNRLMAGELKTYRTVPLFQHKDGRCIPVQLETSVARTAAGKVRYLVAQGQDISARLAYEERLRALLQSAVDGVCIHDLDGAIVEFSRSFADMLGYSPDEVGGLNMCDIEVGPSADELKALFRGLAQSGSARVEETRNRRKDGSLIDVEINAKAIELEGKAYVYASARDIGERVRMRNRLDAERRRQRDFANSTSDWFWELDEALTFTYVSETFGSINGVSPPAYIGVPMADFLARNTLSPDETKAKGLEILHGRKPYRDYEFACKDVDGEVQWLSASGVPILTDDGSFGGWRNVATIVTGRKRTELALEHNRRLLQDLVDAAPYGIAVFDQSYNCVVRNANYARILDLPEDLTGREPFRVIDQIRYCYRRGDFGFALSETDLIETFERRVTAGGAPSSERRLGNGRWIERRVEILPRAHIMLTYFDVTSYKTIESELRAAKDRLEAAAAAGIIGTWEVDAANARTFWDRVQRQLFGVPETDFEVTSEVFYALVHPDDRERVRAAVQQPGSLTLEFRIVRHDGAVRRLRGLSQTICGPDGKALRVVGVTYDVTEQTEALHALERAKAQAEQANRAKSIFLANMSHEIRTPLNAIVGMTEILAHTPLDDEQANCVRTLESAGHSMLVLLTDVLDLSKIEAGQLDLTIAPFSLDDVIRGVVDTFAMAASGKGLVLRTETPPDGLPLLLGDPIRVGQVLTNLVGNAVKFTARGEVTISVRTLERSATSVRLRVAVSDTGIGIAADNIGKLFEPFVQTEGTYGKFGGTGLGLAISKRIVRLMGGDIGVESELGKGSEFWFVAAFEAAAAPAERAHPEDRESEQRLEGVRVLVVDDTETNREIAVKLLSLRGARCETAENGRAAIERLRAAPDAFDIVLMDVQMPGMDGLEATRLIRHELKLSELPVIALTAGAMASQREAALAAGMNGFIAKPFRLRELMDGLSPWVGDKKSKSYHIGSSS